MNFEEIERQAFWHFAQKFTPYEPGDYDRWMLEEPRPEIQSSIRPSGTPLLSVVVCVYEASDDLSATLNSITCNFSKIEIILTCTNHAMAHCRKYVHPGIRLAHQDHQFDLLENSAIRVANGQFILFVSAGDVLATYAIDYLVRFLETHPKVLMTYFNEDWIDFSGNRSLPRFKSQSDNYAQLSFDLMGRSCILRVSRLREIGGFDRAVAPAHHYDIHLRYSAMVQPARIMLLPYVLYHRRIPTIKSPLANEDAARKFADAARRAVSNFLGCEVVRSPLAEFINRPMFPLPDSPPLVSILIPTRDRSDLLKNCISSIVKNTSYVNYEIVVLDNGSQEPATLSYFKSLITNSKIRILPIPGEFNYSKINNRGVDFAKGDIIVFMNNDVEVITPGWLRDMVALALRGDVGCVGAKLLYGDGTIQHAGIALEAGSLEASSSFAAHVSRRRDKSELGSAGELAGLSSYSAVTAACLAIKRAVFCSVGRFDEEALKVGYNDVDLCLRVEELGYNNVLTPFEPLFHLEGVSRQITQDPIKMQQDKNEQRMLIARWSDRFSDDRFSRNFVKISWHQPAKIVQHK